VLQFDVNVFEVDSEMPRFCCILCMFYVC